MFRRSFLPALFLVVCTSLHADVTTRMSFDVKVNLAIPGGVPELPFSEILTRIKGDHRYEALGPVVAVKDVSTGKITLIDPKTRHYATFTIGDYLSALSGQHMQNLPDAAKQALAKLKFDVESHDTGRSSRIRGIDVLERETVVNLSIPVPIPGQQHGMQLSIKLQLWRPEPGEFERVPALRELAADNARRKTAAALRQAFGTVPGMDDLIGKLTDEVAKSGNVVLRTHIGIYVPGLAQILEQAGAKDLAAVPPGDQSLVEANLDLKELSTDKVPDEVFAIPAGYKEASIDEMAKGVVAAFTGGKIAAARPAEPQSSELSLGLERNGTDFLLTWNKNSAAVAKASHGVLSIIDGDRHERYDMDPNQLKTGSIVYTPVTSDVAFTLDVTGTDGSKIAATVRSQRPQLPVVTDGKSPASPQK